MAIRPFLLGSAVALCAVSCAAPEDSTSTIPFVDEESEAEVAPTVPATLISEPDAVLESASKELVAVHASWMCELQRRTFADPGDIELALREHLERSGSSVAAYQEFLVDLAARQDFRDAVLYEYQTSCLRD